MIREDWVEAKLGDVFFTTSGGTPSRRNPSYYEGNIPWVKSGELNYNVIRSTEEHITEEAIENSSAKIFPEGTLLIALYGATIGKLAILGVPAATNQAVCGIYKNKNIETKFIYYYLFFKKPKLIEQGIGGAQPNISQTILKRLDVPLAPLPEQRAIVAKIEELFSELNSGIASLKKAKEQLEVYRQAVLKAAFEGNLTRKWREENNFDNLSSWKLNKLDEVLITIDGDRGKNYPKKHEYLSDGYCLFLSTKNVLKGAFDFRDNVFISKEKDEILRGGKLERGDIVITTRGTLGNVAYYDGKTPYENVRINSGMLILRLKDKDVLHPLYLMQFINSSLFVQQLRRKQSGTAQPQIPARVLKEIAIKIPSSLKEQEEIIKEIESRLSVCENIEATIEEALEKAEALRQSVLKKAFEGKLLSNEELEACRRESDWEPAEDLLKRIKEDKKEAKSNG